VLSRLDALAKVVFECMRPGNGRSNVITRVEIAERLLAADLEFGDEELADLLERMADVGAVTLVREAPGLPLGSDNWGELDDLESDICKVLKTPERDAGYTSDEQLELWLSEAVASDGCAFDASGGIFSRRDLVSGRGLMSGRSGMCTVVHKG
jgi:hypothetical protein